MLGVTKLIFFKCISKPSFRACVLDRQVNGYNISLKGLIKTHSLQAEFRDIIPII